MLFCFGVSDFGFMENKARQLPAWSWSRIPRAELPSETPQGREARGLVVVAAAGCRIWGLGFGFFLGHQGNDSSIRVGYEGTLGYLGH